MRGTRRDLIRVGLFVVVAGTILAGGLMWIAGTRLFRPVATYTILFDRSVSGLNAGSNVEYQGVVVGRVRDIRLTADIPPHVAVVCDLEPNTPVRADTYAELVGSLVTGIKYIQLEGGSTAAAPLASGGTMHGEAPSLEEFRDRLTEIADRVASILRRLEQDVFTEANSGKLTNFIDDLGSVASTLNRTMQGFRAEQTGKDFAELVSRLSEVAASANAVLADFHARRDSIYGSLDSTLRSLDATAQEARALVRGAQREVNGASGSLGTLASQLATTTERLQETLDELRSDPSVLLWGRSVPKREFEQ